jgi:threonine dehydrogenase-like Zn-dependent dehydrogenase
MVIHLKNAYLFVWWVRMNTQDDVLGVTMRAVVWQAPRTIAVKEVADPRIEEPTDAIIRVTHTGICGSDLHLYDHGATMGMLPGDILGHEAVGVVEETGHDVTRLNAGQRVVIPFNISCGHCALCRRQLFSQCETTQNLRGRKGGSLFGYTHLYGGVAGGQAEYLRVPQAQFGPIVLEDWITDPTAVLLADVLPTAWQAVEYADIPPGGTVAIYGLGPIGLTCVVLAQNRGANRVISVDNVPERLSLAQAHGAEVVNYHDVDDVPEVVKNLTDGRGADAVIDAVGMDADGSFADKLFQTLKIQPDRMVALHQALGSVRRGGTVSVIGVYGGWMPAFPIGDLFDKQITLRWGQANVRRWTDVIIEQLRANRLTEVTSIISTYGTLDDAAHLYRAFRDKEKGVVKVIMTPNTLPAPLR